MKYDIKEFDYYLQKEVEEYYSKSACLDPFIQLLPEVDANKYVHLYTGRDKNARASCVKVGMPNVSTDIEMLINEPNPLIALQKYDAERVPAAAKVVMQNRAKGPDQIMDMMEERFPEGFSESEIPHDELETVMNHNKIIAGFDVQSLNQKS